MLKIRLSPGKILPLLLVLFFLDNYEAIAQATRTWNASGNSNWNNASNWSPSGVPGNNDIVIFDNTSDFNCAIDVNVRVDSISMEAGYDGIVSQGVGFSLQFDAGANFEGGTFTGGDSPIDVFESFTLAGTTFTSTTDTLSFFEGGGGSHSISFTSGSFSHNNGEVLFSLTSSPTSIDGDFSFYNLICIGLYRELDFSNDVTVVNDLTIDNTNGSIILDLQDTLTVQGDLTLQGSNDFPINFNDGDSNIGTLKFEGANISLNAIHDAGGGSASLYISGTGTQSINGTATSGLSPLPDIKIECSSLNLTGYVTLIGNDWEYISGTLGYPSNFELNVVGSSSISGNSHTLDSLTITGNYTTTSLLAPLTIDGEFTINSTNQTQLSIQSGFDVQNDLILNTSAGDGFITLNIAANNKSSVNGNLITTGANDISINTDTLLISGDINIAHTGNGGGGSGVVELAGTTQTFSVDSGVGDDEGLIPSLYINTSNTLNFSTGSTFNLTGTWNYEQGTLNLSGATIAVTASNNAANHVRIMGNPHTLTSLDFRGTYGYLDIDADVTFTGNLNIESNATAGTATLTLTNGLSVAGNLTTSGADGIFINSDTISVSGNLDIKHTGTGGGSGAVAIVGTGAQLLAGGSQYPEGYLPDVVIDKPSGTLTLENFVTVNGDWSLDDGLVDSRTNGSTLTISDASARSLDLTSPDGNMELDSLIVDVTRFGGLAINANLNARGDITILDGQMLSSNDFNISVGGDWTNSNTTDDGFNEGTGTVTLNGTTSQTISCASCTNGEVFGNLVINNTTNSSGNNDIFLDNSIQITNSITLTDGVIQTDTDALLLIPEGVSISLGSDQSFVNGRVSIEKASTGLTTLNFPIGKDSNYGPIALDVNHNTATSYTYVSETFNSSSAGLGYGIDSELRNLSAVRYWDIGRSITGGANAPSTDLSGNATITIYYNINDEVDDFTELRIAKYDGTTQWESIGGTASGNGAGNIVSTSSPVAFDAFSGEITLANSLLGENSLPVEMNEYRLALFEGQPLLRWSTSIELNNSHFEIERSLNGNSFHRIGLVTGKGNSNQENKYSYHDISFKNQSTYYYRLRQVDFDGVSEVFETIRIELDEVDGRILITFDKSSSNLSFKDFHSGEKIEMLEIRDLSGKLLLSRSDVSLDLKLPPIPQVVIVRIWTNYRTVSQKILLN